MPVINEDGMVAVVYSPGYGGGWYTWNTGLVGSEMLVFDPIIVDAVLKKDTSTTWITDIEKRVEELFGKDEYVSMVGLDQLEVEWLPRDTKFVIQEYDGSEYIQLDQHFYWLST